MQEKKNLPVLLGILIVAIIMVVGVTYALWQIVLQQETTNVITTGCFQMTLEEENGTEINLEKAYPIVDADGKKLTPFVFKLVNTCDSKAGYSIALETIDTSSLSEQYLKVSLNNGMASKLSLNPEVTPILENASHAYILESGYLNGNEEKEYELRIWLDENTPASDEVMNKTWSGKITINASMIPQTTKMLRAVSVDDEEGMWEYKTNISKVVIQNELNPIEGVIKVSDESALKDGSVMSYVVENEDGETYTAYLQSADTLILNSDSSNLFYDFKKVTGFEGLSYLDTSKVTNMSRMFYDCISLTSLDLSTFDTSNVTNMQNMFYTNSVRELPEIGGGEFEIIGGEF